MNIGKKIKDLRIDLGITQNELAEMLGYTSRSTINKIEMGINDITQSKIASFAKALKTTPAYLMGWEEKENSRIQELYNLLNDNNKNALETYAEGLIMGQYNIGIEQIKERYDRED